MNTKDFNNLKNKVSRRTFLRGMTAAASMVLAESVPPKVYAHNRTPMSNWSTRADNQVVEVYSALNGATNNQLVAAFNADFPNINLELLPIAAAGDLQARVRAEKDSPKGDVFIGGSSEFHSPLASEGLLTAYKSPNASAIEDQYKDPDGYWTGWYIGIIGFGYNKDRLSAEMANTKKPTTWDDLLDPAWKGNLTLGDPVKTGGGYIFLATQIFRFAVQMGIVPAVSATMAADATMAATQATGTGIDYTKAEDAAMDFAKKLNDNIGQYTDSGPQAIQLVSTGQFIGTPNWSHDILTSKSKGLPIDLVIPEQTGFEIGAISLIKGGPNSESAKIFIDWILTKPAAELNVKLSNRLSVLKDVASAPEAPTLDQVKLVPYDRQWATANKDRLLKKWQAATSA